MSDNTRSPASVSIDRINISGVSAVTARATGAAIEQALAAAASEGRIASGHRPRLTITLPPGASERDIAAALARALARKPEQR